MGLGLIAMNDLPQQQLIILIAKYGTSLCNDPQRCEALLRDYCSQHHREVALLVNALKEQVPNEIISSAGRVPQAVVRARLIKRLEENLCITDQAAAWAVDSWSKALGSEAKMEEPDLNKTLYEPAKLILPETEPERVKLTGQEKKNQRNTNQSISQGKPRWKNYLLIGGIGTGMIAAIAMVYRVQYQQGWAKMQAVLVEAQKLQTDKKFKVCINKAETIVGYGDLHDKAQVLANQCRLSLARQLATDAKLSEAISTAKKVTSIAGDSSYRESQNLVTDWSQGRWLKIENSCSHPVTMFVRFSDPTSNAAHKVDGWWSFKASETSVLADNSNTRIRMLDPIFFYAEATDDAKLEWAGNETTSFEGKNYKTRPMESIRMEEGKYVGTLTCDKP